ncbi:hypothetical protein FHU10_0868 [Serratia fonticola]|uniref:Type IV secretion protein Rhs n=1 Tax=Serratia fonticola TaxID=47917 RepID=A0A559T1F4_SERFO|nr:type IV secretion protein Rhs [Serratia fonticola]TQI79069.1 hypothetical protein FHU09_1580 [Serratia fonticola]TQI98909.1 hypothetical protein FHU11_4470 [Serratia fonticola]TVZ68434.1 hypothetical protein FHU10_0868 [Serratia fonticola]
MEWENVSGTRLTKEGQLRRLTTGEIALARSIFGSSINYSKVWIHLGSYLPFGLQNRYTAMTPNGELYFRRELYSDDYSTADKGRQHLFIHEMTHVWQYQNGMWVKLRGSMSWAVSYYYNFKDKTRLSEYSMEQQGAIVADYFFLLKYGNDAWQGNPNLYYSGDFEKDMLPYYELILSDFPKY